MTAYVKSNDAYVNVRDAYVKRSGAWVKAQAVYYKINGAWVRVHVPLSPPPQAPVISLTVNADKHIRVGARYPSAGDDTSIRMIRVLASRQAMPTSQFGSGFINEAAHAWPDEPWSEWRYYLISSGGFPATLFREHPDTSILDLKTYPPNADHDTPALPTGQWFYFAGWTQDNMEQWSVGTFNKVFVPTGSISGTIFKEATFLPISVGTLTTSGSTYVAGDAVNLQPGKNAYLSYGPRFIDAMGQDGTVSNVSATVRLHRVDEDNNSPSANVWAYWTDISGAWVPSGNRNSKTPIGTLAKGETKTMALPTTGWTATNWANSIRGIVFGYTAPAVNGDNFTLIGQSLAPIQGEVHVTWQETP